MYMYVHVSGVIVCTVGSLFKANSSKQTAISNSTNNIVVTFTPDVRIWVPRYARWRPSFTCTAMNTCI